jgi:hypothetical protein
VLVDLKELKVLKELREHKGPKDRGDLKET